MIVDLPHPLSPTNAIFFPLGILRVILSKITKSYLLGYLNVTFLIRISPLNLPKLLGLGGFKIFGSLSKIAKTLTAAALPLAKY